MNDWHVSMNDWHVSMNDWHVSMNDWHVSMNDWHVSMNDWNVSISRHSPLTCIFLVSDMTHSHVSISWRTGFVESCNYTRDTCQRVMSLIRETRLNESCLSYERHMSMSHTSLSHSPPHTQERACCVYICTFIYYSMPRNTCTAFYVTTYIYCFM